MANILDYVHWRGDLSFLQDQFNILDNLIFAKLAYIDFKDAVPDYPSQKKILAKNAMNKDTKRFGRIYMSNYVNIIEKESKTQFSAVVFHLDEDTIYIAFRGTDDTLIGWQENIDMLYTSPVKSQVLAVKYLEDIADLYPNVNIYLGGHSKGGNLATGHG